MCPKELAMIMKDAFDSFESWYKNDCTNKAADREARHRVFDGTISAIGFVKDGTLNKNALVNTFRALADFYEKEL